MKTYSGKIKVNKELLPVKAQNFLKYGACGVFSFLPVLCRQKGIPNEGIGIMWSIFPLVNIVSYLFLSQIADRFSCHRLFFMLGLFTMTFGFAGVCIMPNINHIETTNSLQYLKPNSLLLNCKDNILNFGSCNELKGNSHFSDCSYNTTLAKFDETCEINCSSNLSGNENIAEANGKIPNRQFNNIKVKTNSNSTCVVGNCVTINLEHEVFDLIGSLSCDMVYPVKCEISCDYPEKKEVKAMSMSETITYFEFWLILFIIGLMYSGNSTATTMCDTATFVILGEKRHLYGFQRLWGSLAWGIMGIVNGAVVDYFSKGLPEKDYKAAFILSISIMVGAFISGVFIKFKIPKRDDTGSGSIFTVFSSGKVILFMVCILIIGGSQGILWTFLLMLIEDVSFTWDPDFQSLTLVQGLTLAIACFVGEVPLMFLSGHIIRRLGNIRTFTLALVAYCLRLFLISFVVNPWYVIPIEVLHGVSFGVFYPNMSAYASKIAPKGKKATLQGTVKAIFGIGTALGSLIGGALYKIIGGSNLFFYCSLFDTAFTIFFVLCQYFLAKRNNTRTKDINEIKEPTDPQNNVETALLPNEPKAQIVRGN